MRRPLAASAIALSLAASLLGGVARADESSGRLRPDHAPTAVAAVPAPGAHEVLRTAQAVLGGDESSLEDRSATMALRNLFAARPRLTGTARAAANEVLGRPATDHRACGAHVCVHWTTTGTDAATSTWARKTLRYVGHVWRTEVDGLHFRAPLQDGQHGGSPDLDVYLQDLGGQGLYGYCAPELLGDRPGTASGFCVLDNDFSRAQFGVRPANALRVTAAHEFFHASQFAYDYREDAWLMEATATWMEEQVADRIDDNRQYLPHSQLAEPLTSLDYYNDAGVEQYGQWIYFQYLQQTVGDGIVHKIWTRLPGRKNYSVRVLDEAIKGSFVRQYAGFVAANVLPAKFYAEGHDYPRAHLDRVTLDAGTRSTRSVTLDHLSASAERFAPGTGLEQRTAQLRVRMDGPRRATGPALVVVWQGTSGKIRRYPIATDRAGRATKIVRFSSENTKAVYVAAVNASTRYDCRQDAPFACQGVSRDDGRRFDLVVRPVTG
jgi:hypothetical protein